MPDHLYLRLIGSSDSAAIVALNDEGELLGPPEMSPLSEIADRAGDARIHVLLPADEIVSCMANVPAAGSARLRQMLPFALEDEFVSNVEDLHFAAGERNAAGELAVSVIDRARLSQWLEELNLLGLNVRDIVSEADAVPDTPGTLTLFVEGSSILGRLPGSAPFAFGDMTIGELWDLLETETGDDAPAYVVLFTDPATFEARELEFAALRERVENLDVKQLAEGCLPRLAANLIHSPGIDLRQGSFAPKSNYGAMLRPWRAAAALLAVAVGLLLVGEAVKVFKFGRDEVRLAEAITAECAANYSSTQISACRLEAMRRLDAAGQAPTAAGGGFLATQALVAEAGGTALEMESMSYRDGVLSLVFLAPNVPFVDTFAQSVSASGRFQVVDPSTSSEPNGVRTRLRIAPVAQ